MQSYSDFAYVYDTLMGEVDYKERTEYICELFCKFGEMPTLLLDVACGTGGFSNQFALKGIEVIGTDMSEDMLSVARENSVRMGAQVLYLCQRAEELDLYGTVDGAICCMDSVNHITDKADLQKAFNKISLFLEPNKLFIFDANTVYKQREVLGDNTFVLEEEEVYCVWQNRWNDEDKTTDIALDLFSLEGEAYFRSSEDFSEKAYTREELEEMLRKAGFTVKAVFDDLTQNPPTEKSERLFYVCIKKSA